MVPLGFTELFLFFLLICRFIILFLACRRGTQILLGVLKRSAISINYFVGVSCIFSFVLGSRSLGFLKLVPFYCFMQLDFLLFLCLDF